MSREARSIIERAEQAAAAGNYSSAEALLRDAAVLQEETLGPQHPDLANTLNNLGIVCEMTDNPIDAEHYFRRAFTIATATLAPDHPFVATSRKNLHDFCAARGRPVELPPSPPQVAAWLDAPPTPPKRSLRPLTLGALSVMALLIVVVMARSWSSSAREASSPPATATAPAREAPAPLPAEPTDAAAQPSRPEADARSGAAPAPRATAETPAVVTAQLCTALNDWQCEAASSQVRPGLMFFYTQIKSATATTITHRWYEGDRLRQAVPLRIEANPGAGYRTYSRNTVSSERAGDWHVELQSADGVVLYEERFTVR